MSESTELDEMNEGRSVTPLAAVEERARALDPEKVAAWVEALAGPRGQYSDHWAARQEVLETGAHAFAALRPALTESLPEWIFRTICAEARERDDAEEFAWVAADIFARGTNLERDQIDCFKSALSYYTTDLAEPLAEPLAYQLSGPDSEQEIELYELFFERAPGVDADVLVDGLESSSKVVREGCIEALVKHCNPQEYRARLVEKIIAQEKTVRQGAAEVLARVGAAPVRREVEAVLDDERAADVRALLEKAVEIAGRSVFEIPDQGAAPAELIVFLENFAIDHEVPEFLDLDALPPLEFTDGTKIEGEALRGLVIRLALEDDKNEDVGIRKIRPYLDDASANEFSVAIKDQWANADTAGKDKWAICQQGVMASDERISDIASQFADLTMNGRYVMVGWYIEALERNGSKVALSWLYHWMHHAERESLKSNAQVVWKRWQKRRGVTAIELEAQINPYIGADAADAAVPRLDVDDVRRVDYGSREIEIFVDQNLRVHSRDDKEKVRDSMPSPRKADDKDKVAAARAVFRDLKGALDEAKEAVFERLEHAMVTGRPWSKEAFEELFVDHPLMSRIAGLFVFATDEGQTFRLLGREYLDPDYDEVVLPENATIRLVHRLNLSDEVARAWSDHLADAELVPPFAQLDRPSFEPGDVDLNVEVNPGTLAGRLLRLGWRRWGNHDGGMITQASRLFAGHGVRAVLSHGRFYVGNPSNPGNPVEIESLEFQTRKGEHQEQHEVPVIALSETLYDLARIIE